MRQSNPLSSPKLAWTTPREAGFSQDKLARIDAFYSEMIAGGLMPNMAYALARKGRVFARGDLGWADILARKPLRQDSIFRLLSMTKAYTGAAILLLCDDGLVSLDDSIADYVPAFRSMRVWSEGGSQPASRPITIEHLLTHTSGLTSGFFQNPVADLYLENGLQEGTREAQAPTLEHYVDKLAAQPLLAQPGEAWNYSEGLAVCGRLVEVVTGTRYGDFLRRRVFEPIGATDTGFFTATEDLHRMVALYGAEPFTGKLHEYREMLFPRVSAPVFHPLDVTRRPGADLGGAGLVGTLEDALRFAMMLAGRGALNEAAILKAETVEQMRRGRVYDRLGPHAMMKYPLDERAVGLDMGLGVVTVRDPAICTHAGAAGSFSFAGSAGTRFWVDPELELAAVFFTQTMNSPAPYFAPFAHFVYDALVRR